MTKAAARLTNTDKQITTIDFSLAARWIKFAQVSASSVQAYEKGIKRLAEYFCAANITAPTRADLISYRDYLGSKYQPTTANLYLTTAKLFFSFLQVEGYITFNPAEHLKGFKISSEHKKAALSVEQTKTVIKNFDTTKLQGLRDKAIYALMTACGLRCVEVQHANISDLYKVGAVYRLQVQGKGHTQKDSAVNVPAGVMKLINDYLAARGVVEVDAPLFSSLSRRNFGGRLTTYSISRIIKTALRKSNFDSPRLTAHSLRHSAATVALKNGATLREVQQLLRHVNIAVTTIYLHELDALQNQASNLAASAFGF